MEVHETHQNNNHDGSTTVKGIKELNIYNAPEKPQDAPRQQPGRKHIFNQVWYRLIKSSADVDANVKPVFVQHAAHQGSDGRIYDCLGTEGKVYCPLLEVSGPKNF